MQCFQVLSTWLGFYFSGISFAWYTRGRYCIDRIWISSRCQFTFILVYFTFWLSVKDLGDNLQLFIRILVFKAVTGQYFMSNSTIMPFEVIYSIIWFHEFRLEIFHRSSQVCSSGTSYLGVSADVTNYGIHGFSVRSVHVGVDNVKYLLYGDNICVDSLYAYWMILLL